MLLPSATLDLTELRLLFGEHVYELRAFCSDVANAIERVEREIAIASERHEWAKVRESAHQLKGLSGNAGAHGLAAQCAALEALAKRDEPAVPAALPALKAACDGVCDALRRVAPATNQT